MPATLQSLLAGAQALVETLDLDALSGPQARELVESFVALERVSSAQADLISAAAAAAPGAESALLEHARSSGMNGLRTECQRVIAAASSELEQRERAERAHRARTLRHHQYGDGTGKIVVHGPLDRTAQIMASLEPHEQALFEEHRRAHSPEHPEAIAFDALVRVCTRTENESEEPRRKGGRPLGVCVLHVSHDAYLRGFLQPGELCEIEGAGPVPVSTAHRLASDAILRAVVTDGIDIRLVSHLGRTIPAHLRTAVETLDRVCTIEGCEVDRHLQIDHNDPVAALGRTELANLGRMCHHHHDLKTRRDLRRLGPRGRQRLVTRAEYEAAPRGPPVVGAA